MLIDGIFIGGVCDQGTGKEVIRNPFDDSIVGTAAEGSWAEADAALHAAKRAFALWRFSPISSRQALLLRIAALVRERAEELAMLLVAEVGKPVVWARGEVNRLAITFELAAKELEHWTRQPAPLDSDPRGADYEAFVERQPRGVVLGIVPYNWPYNLAAHKLAPAIATGNTIVIKPSQQALLSTMTLGRLIHEAGCPPGVVNVVNVHSKIAERMVLDDRVSFVSFTGSPKVGWHLKEETYQKHISLELGGDASAVVFADAIHTPTPTAEKKVNQLSSRIAAGAYGYAGQICISIQHALVHQTVYEEVREGLIEATNACIHGDPSSEETVCGPMISSDAADRVESWVSEAVSNGAQVIAGGGRTGNVIHPTLIEGVPPPMKLACEEVFGPVLTLRPFVSVASVIEELNRSQSGIHVGDFPEDRAIGERFFREVEVGGVIVGDYPTLRFDALPYGGVKKSGFGREGVRYAMEEMSEPKSLVFKRA